MASELSELTREELLELVEAQRRDWDKINEFINTQATMFGWCDEYEERLLKYNPSFEVFQVHGRFPEGKRVSVRNAFAARRLVMGHVINTLSQHGFELPDGALCGVVRDHQALNHTHEQITEHLSENPEAFISPGTPTPLKT